MSLSFTVAGISNAAESGVWSHFRDHFISSDGRVIDEYQNDMSHSEGQGFTMYLAVCANDRIVFDRLLHWTKDNLMVRKNDSLAGWSWGKKPDGEWGLLDLNNASDGDIFIAWALLKAGERWHSPEYTQAAKRIIADIRRLLIVNRDGVDVLLPGADGFVENGAVVFNPSYFIFPAFNDFAKVDEAAFGEKCHADCLTLLGRSLVGQQQLPPDWAMLKDGNVGVWPKRPRQFSYDAIRIPLYLAWDDLREPLSHMENLFRVFRDTGSVPACIPLLGDAASNEEASAGFYAILAKAAHATGQKELSLRLTTRADTKIQEELGSYYSCVLYLLAKTECLL